MRSLAESPRVAIAAFPRNKAAKIVGTISLDWQPLISPLTGRPCAYYEIEVEERRKSGDSHRWVTIVRESAEIEFRVTDESGYAIVDPARSQVAIHVDSKSRSGSFDDATPMEKAFLERLFCTLTKLLVEQEIKKITQMVLAAMAAKTLNL